MSLNEEPSAGSGASTPCARNQVRQGSSGLFSSAAASRSSTRVERAVLAQEGGRGQRRHLVGQQAQVLDVGIAPGAEADGQVGVLGHHVQQRNGHLQRQVDLGVGLDEAAQARHQDGAREGRRDGHAAACACPGRPRCPGKRSRLARPSRTWARYSLPSVVSEKSARPNSLVPRICSSCRTRWLTALGVTHSSSAASVTDAQARQRLEGEQALDGRDARRHGGSVMSRRRDPASAMAAPQARAIRAPACAGAAVRGCAGSPPARG